MKTKIFILFFSLFFASSYSQVNKSTTFGLNLGGAVSIFFQDSSDLKLTKKQYREIEKYQRRYEREYNDWYSGRNYNEKDRRYKQQQMVQNIRIDIENIMTINQRNTWHGSKNSHYNKKSKHKKKSNYKKGHHKYRH